jgi:hypothetical protein
MPLNPVERLTGKPKAQFADYSDPEVTHWADQCCDEIRTAQAFGQRPVDFSGLDRVEPEAKKRGLTLVTQRIADVRIWVVEQQKKQKAAGGRTAP